MLAISEALVGQIYLVSVVALLVANLGRERRSATAVVDDFRDEDPDDTLDDEGDRLSARGRRARAVLA